MDVVEFTVPIRTVSEANKRLATKRGVFAKMRRVRKQREQTRLVWVVAGYTASGLVPCRVRLTRISPHQLDDDNVRPALKAVRDEVAAILGIDDRDPRVAWSYSQERGGVREYAVRVRITPGLGAVHEFRALPAATREALIKSIGHGSLVARVLEEIAA